jgi:hypothetical protein
VKTNDSIMFTALASGLAPFKYQWSFNGTNSLKDGLKNGAIVSGSTNSTLSLSNLTTNNAGKYSVQVIDATGGIKSSSDSELKVQ